MVLLNSFNETFAGTLGAIVDDIKLCPLLVSLLPPTLSRLFLRDLLVALYIEITLSSRTRLM